jgi:hypothetical protein
MITYKEHRSSKYPPRTWENANADATIAFAFDFNTPGERLTRDAVETQDKLYIPVSPSFISSGKVKATAILLTDKKVRTLNIAGNSLPTVIKYDYTQMGCDVIVWQFLELVFKNPEFDCDIKLICSGGQSGFDESGIKAAVALNIPALIVCPKGFKFINEHGETICDEFLFKQRFEK